MLKDQHALIALSLPVSGGSARDDADGWLPIHFLRILREPDEEVTRGHRHHQALGGCLARVGQHIAL
jgi:hypothetical protein